MSSRKKSARKQTLEGTSLEEAPPTVPAGPYEFKPYVSPLKTFVFDDSTNISTIIAIINDISIDKTEVTTAINNLSTQKLIAVLMRAIADPSPILDMLSYSSLIKLKAESLPPPLLQDVTGRIKANILSISSRRRPSTTDIASLSRELFTSVGSEEFCFFRGLNLDTLLVMCELFPLLQFAQLSQYTRFMTANTEAMSNQLVDTENLTAILQGYAYPSGSRHTNAYVKAGKTWYNADDSNAILRERTGGRPTWKTGPPRANTTTIFMIFCYADLSKIPPLFAEPPPGALHGHPTFANDGMGSCSIDALSAILCFANGFRDIMSRALNAKVTPSQPHTISDAIAGHMGHSRERVQDVPACLSDVGFIIGSFMVAPLSGPIFTEHAPPPEGNILPISTAPKGSIYFSKQHRLPSSTLLSRFISYIAGTCIRFFSIRVEAGLGLVVEIDKNDTVGMNSQLFQGPKTLALPARVKHSTRRRTVAHTARPGAAVKATRRVRPKPLHRSLNRRLSRFKLRGKEQQKIVNNRRKASAI